MSQGQNPPPPDQPSPYGAPAAGTPAQPAAPGYPPPNAADAKLTTGAQPAQPAAPGYPPPPADAPVPAGWDAPQVPPSAGSAPAQQWATQPAPPPQQWGAQPAQQWGAPAAQQWGAQPPPAQQWGVQPGQQWGAQPGQPPQHWGAPPGGQPGYPSQPGYSGTGQSGYAPPQQVYGQSQAAVPYGTRPPARSPLLGMIALGGVAVCALVFGWFMWRAGAIVGPLAVSAGRTLSQEQMTNLLINQLGAEGATALSLSFYGGVACWIAGLVATITRRGRGYGIWSLILGVLAPVIGVVVMIAAMLPYLS